MLRALVILSVLFGINASTNLRSTSIHKSYEQSFEAWRSKHGYLNRFTSEVEYLKRLAIFAENMERIETHNAKNTTWSMGMNEYGHLSSDEFKEMYTGVQVPETPSSIPRRQHVVVGDSPNDVDWTTKGAVTDVKNQGSCGSCWSFSTTGGLEGAYFLKTGTLTSFSEQNLVSCDKVDQGCNGGLMDNAFKFIESNGGLCTEADYPYTSGAGATGECLTTCTPVADSQVTGFVDVAPTPQVTPATVAQMESAVAQQPVSIAIEADQSSFQFYKSGVMTSACGTRLDHGVLAVGYGTLNGTDYWKVKNSWGPSWGDSGYILLQKGLTTQKGDGPGALHA